jgi:hypothetical protein
MQASLAQLYETLPRELLTFTQKTASILQKEHEKANKVAVSILCMSYLTYSPNSLIVGGVIGYVIRSASPNWIDSKIDSLSEFSKTQATTTLLALTILMHACIPAIFPFITGFATAAIWTPKETSAGAQECNHHHDDNETPQIPSQL